MSADAIARLDQWLSRSRPDYYSALQAGVTPAAVEAFESRYSVRLPATYRALLQWRNGQRPGCFSALQFNRMFLPLEQVAEAKELLDGLVGVEFENPDWWRVGWLPFLYNGGGDYLCMELGAGLGEERGRVSRYWHDWEDRTSEYPSIDAWLDTFVDSLEAGLWHDADGDLHPLDDNTWETFWKARNPGYPLAREVGGAA